MTLDLIKARLSAHNLHIWQLCQAMGVSKSTFYKYSHVNFKGHEKLVKDSMRKVLSKEVHIR